MKKLCLVLVLTAVCLTCSVLLPACEATTLDYTGMVMAVSYDTNAFGGLPMTTLYFDDGWSLLLQDRVELELNIMYRITYCKAGGDGYDLLGVERLASQ